MYSIIQDFNLTNGTNDKIAKLKKYKDNELFTRILEMAYDKVRFTYGVTMKNVVTSRAIKNPPYMPLETALDHLNHLVDRTLTGNAAISHLGKLCDSVSAEDSIILQLIIGRDLKIGIGRTNINKVHKGLIVKPVYKRCGIFNLKTASKIVFPAFCQLKADGTYRETLVKDGVCYFMSRSGESYEYPTISAEYSANHAKDGYYFGELTVEGITNRSIGNGMINSDDCPHDKLIYSVWEYCTEDEYIKAKNKEKGNLPDVKYIDTFNELSIAIEMGSYEKIRMIETIEVYSATDAMKQCVLWMQDGLEGAVLKNKNMVMKDGTSTDQLKMKLEIAVEVRCKSFKEGETGKNKGLLTSIVFENDEGTVKGSCGGLDEKMLKLIRENPEQFYDKVFSLVCNDITKGAKNVHYALSHPRFDEWRNDKNTTDTLERMQEQKKSAMLLENIM